MAASCSGKANRNNKSGGRCALVRYSSLVSGWKTCIHSSAHSVQSVISRSPFSRGEDFRQVVSQSDHDFALTEGSTTSSEKLHNCWSLYSIVPQPRVSSERGPSHRPRRARIILENRRDVARAMARGASALRCLLPKLRSNSQNLASECCATQIDLLVLCPKG